MKKILLSGIIVAGWTATVVNAISISGQAGEDYTAFEVGLGTETPGLYSTLSWAHSDDEGNISGIGLGLIVPLGSLHLSAGGKILYLDPSERKEGYATAVGGGIGWPLSASIAFYGSGYYSPDSLSSGVSSYSEGNAGVRLTLFRPLSVDIGYRYMNMKGKDNENDKKLADGIYVGVGVGF